MGRYLFKRRSRGDILICSQAMNHGVCRSTAQRPGIPTALPAMGEVVMTAQTPRKPRGTMREYYHLFSGNSDKEIIGRLKDIVGRL